MKKKMIKSLISVTCMTTMLMLSVSTVMAEKTRFAPLEWFGGTTIAIEGQSVEEYMASSIGYQAGTTSIEVAKGEYLFHSSKSGQDYDVHTDNGSVLMYRMYNSNSGEHFYTASAEEKDNLYAAGWIYEGIGWIAPEISSTPVYRLYNPNSGDHHYTMSADEKSNLVSVGWNDEGIGWYSDDSQSVALYRQYNPNADAGSHNYTTSSAENDNLVATGWNAEGIGWNGCHGTLIAQRDAAEQNWEAKCLNGCGVGTVELYNAFEDLDTIVYDTTGSGKVH